MTAPLPLRVGVCILPDARWAEARGRWERAEALGFAHAWTYDHLAWRTLRDGPWFAATPTLTAAALATRTIRLGPLVASPNFRHPLTFAKEIVALDDLSGGRLTVGIGAGGTGWDATMLGQPPLAAGARADRFEEFVTCLDTSLREPASSFAGRWYTTDEARTHPGCVQRPRAPFAIAATGPRGFALAARHGATWVTTGSRSTGGPLDAVAGAAAMARQVEALEAACAAAGRDPATIDRLVLTGLELDPGLGSVEAFVETASRYAAAGVTDLVVHWPRPSAPYAGDERAFEALFAALPLRG